MGGSVDFEEVNHTLAALVARVREAVPGKLTIEDALSNQIPVLE